MQHPFFNIFRRNGFISNIFLLAISFFVTIIFSFSTCKYSFKDTSPIPPEIKTFRVNQLENKARFVNPLLAPQLTESLKQKIRSNTRLTQINADSAHYDISGYVSDYSVTTSGISGNEASTNLLTVSFHLIFKNNLDINKNFETDIASSYNFSATQNIAQVEPTLTPDIVKNTVDGIFNKIFSNW